MLLIFCGFESETASKKEGLILFGNNGVMCSRRYDFVGVLEVEMSINIRVVVGEII